MFGKAFKRFVDWVDAHGEDVRDWMVGGSACGGLAGGALGFFAGLLLGSVPLATVAGVVFVLNFCFIVAMS